MNFSERLDSAMHKAGFRSQSALARAAGISQSTINRVLKSTGPNGPATHTIQKLADACGVSFDWLLSGVAKKNTSTSLSPPQYLVYMDADELKIITHYREATLAGKSLIQITCEEAPKSLPPSSTTD